MGVIVPVPSKISITLFNFFLFQESVDDEEQVAPILKDDEPTEIVINDYKNGKVNGKQ